MQHTPAKPIPENMRAYVLKDHGGLDQLEYHEDWPVPSIDDNEVLIKVHACGMNNTDINTRTGWYSKTVKEGTTAEGGKGGFEQSESLQSSWGRQGINFPLIQGADVCGEVVAIGKNVEPNYLHQRVIVDTWLRDWSDPYNQDQCGYYGSEMNGGYAEYTKAPVTNVYTVNSKLNHTELASFATSYITAENMLHQIDLKQGETVLIPGASGGVGGALIQIALARDAIPIAMCSDSKADEVKQLGAHAVLPRECEHLHAELIDTIGRGHVDAVADVVGGSMWPQFIEAIKRDGRYVCAGAIAGPMVEFDLRTFYLRNLTFKGATITPPTLFKRLVNYIEQGKLKPIVAETFALKDLIKAQEMFLSKKHVGNIVIDLSL